MYYDDLHSVEFGNFSGALLDADEWYRLDQSADWADPPVPTHQPDSEAAELIGTRSVEFSLDEYPG